MRANSTHTKWRIKLFGQLEAHRVQYDHAEAQPEHVVKTLKTQYDAGLLAYLAYHLTYANPREVLMEQLWSGGEPEKTSARLAQALYSLRLELESGDTPAGSVLIAGQGYISLDPTTVTTDVVEFEAAIQSAKQTPELIERIKRLRQAADIYNDRGLLPGFYQRWVDPEQHRLESACVDALSDLANALRERAWELGEIAELIQAIENANRAIDLDPLREDINIQLMRLYAEAGRIPDAVRQYQKLERVLRTDLDMGPSATTRMLLGQILAGTIPQLSVGQASDQDTTDKLVQLEYPTGPVESNSPFYIERPTDHDFAIEFAKSPARKQGLILVKGGRQIGKTSMLARGLQWARAAGSRVILTDFQQLETAHFESSNKLLFAISQIMADDLRLKVGPREIWDDSLGGTLNFRKYVGQEVLKDLSTPTFWGLDEVDRLVGCPFCSDIFALLRSLYSLRVTQPDPWAGLSMMIVYATEASLFIKDVHQSPFNVGARLKLEDFTVEHVVKLNLLYGSPLRDQGEVSRYFRLVGGHPFLVRWGLDDMVRQSINIDEWEARTRRDDGIFDGHLHRIVELLHRDKELYDEVCKFLHKGIRPSKQSFERLRTHGVMIGDSLEEIQPRCELYRQYLMRHLR